MWKFLFFSNLQKRITLIHYRRPSTSWIWPLAIALVLTELLTCCKGCRAVARLLLSSVLPRLQIRPLNIWMSSAIADKLLGSSVDLSICINDTAAAGRVDVTSGFFLLRCPTAAFPHLITNSDRNPTSRKTLLVHRCTFQIAVFHVPMSCVNQGSVLLVTAVVLSLVYTSGCIAS